MRLPLLLIPLLALAGCAADSNRATAPSAPSTPTTPAAATPSAPTTPVAAAPSVPATPAAPATVAPAAPVAAKPAPAAASIDLHGFAGPTDNADLFGYDENNSRLFFYSGGAITLPVRLSGDGDYDIIISAACDEAKGEKAKFTVTIDGQAIGNEVTCTTTDAKDYVVKAPGLKVGEHKIAIEFMNDVYKENEYDLNLYVHGVKFQPAE